MSKKFFFTLLFCCIMFVTSCTDALAPTVPPDLNKAISFSAAITYGKFECGGDFIRDANGRWDIKITAPKEISGLMITYQDGKTTAALGGYAFDFEESNLPIKSVCSYLTDSIEKVAALDNLTAKDADGFTKISGTIPEGGFIMTWHKETSAITEIEAAGAKAVVTSFRTNG